MLYGSESSFLRKFVFISILFLEQCMLLHKRICCGCRLHNMQEAGCKLLCIAKELRPTQVLRPHRALQRGPQ
jgi:hypothetical protein